VRPVAARSDEIQRRRAVDVNTLMHSAPTAAVTVPAVAIGLSFSRVPANSTPFADASWLRVARPVAAVRTHAVANAAMAGQSTKSAPPARYAYIAKQAAPPRGQPR
jgi:hypothetical protein